MSQPDSAPAQSSDLFTGVGVLLRRWFVVLPVLIVTGVVAYQVHEDTTLRYAQTTTIGIVTPSVTSTEQPKRRQPVVTQSNALVAAGGTTLVANLVTLNLQQSQIADQIYGGVTDVAYSAAVLERPGTQLQLPVINLQVESSSPEVTSSALQTLTTLASSATRDVQTNAGVPESRIATSYVLQAQERPSTVEPSRTRVTATVCVIGVAIAALLAVIVDAVINRFRRRRTGRRADVSHSA